MHATGVLKTLGGGGLTAGGGALPTLTSQKCPGRARMSDPECLRGACECTGAAVGLSQVEMKRKVSPTTPVEINT